MSQFITGKELQDKLCSIIWDANEVLLLVSPFIRLDKYFRELLDKHKENHKLHIVLIFGKNEGRVDKSLNSDDFEFVKKFPNVSVIYQANLHGKYYGNERSGMITSINLHDHSFDNNIEFGVYYETTILNNLTTNADKAAWNYCRQIADSGLPVYIQRPAYEKKLLSALLGKNYVKSETLWDITNEFYKGKYDVANNKKSLGDFPDELEFNKKTGPMPSKEMPIKESPSSTSPAEQKPESDSIKTKEKSTSGYCIRTGVEINRNPEKPFSYDAYKEWAQYENWDYPEKYCHLTGQPSYGKTTFRKPILNDSYKNK